MFNADGVPMWLRDEKLVRINRDVLPQLVEKYVVAPKAVFTSSGELTVRYEPYVINDVEVRLLLVSKTPQEGGLKFRLPSLQMPPPPVRAPTEDAA